MMTIHVGGVMKGFVSLVSLNHPCLTGRSMVGGNVPTGHPRTRGSV
jgi:hypothetical protein